MIIKFWWINDGNDGVNDDDVDDRKSSRNKHRLHGYVWGPQSLVCWYTCPLKRGKTQRGQGPSGVSAYPALAESDVPPSLPHRAETTAAHATENLLVPVSLHLETRDMREKWAEGGLRRGCCYPKNAARFTSETHWIITLEREPDISRYKHISHPNIAWNVATRSTNHHNNRVMLAITLPNAINKHNVLLIEKEAKGISEKKKRCYRRKRSFGPFLVDWEASSTP